MAQEIDMELDFREFSKWYINTTYPEQPEWEGTRYI